MYIQIIDLEQVEPPRTSGKTKLKVCTQYKWLICNGLNQSNHFEPLIKCIYSTTITNMCQNIDVIIFYILIFFNVNITYVYMLRVKIRFGFFFSSNAFFNSCMTYMNSSSLFCITFLNSSSFFCSTSLNSSITSSFFCTIIFNCSMSSTTTTIFSLISSIITNTCLHKVNIE